MSIFQLFRARKRTRETALKVYEAIVGRSREAYFFRDLGVPDTIDGRFEVLTLHAVLFLRRVKREGEAGEALGRAVSEVLFKDMDHILREMGVGDLSVARKVREMAEAFYGRARAYDEGIEATDPKALEDALLRNMYRGAAEIGDLPQRAASYVQRAVEVLERNDTGQLMLGAVDWGQLDTASSATAS